MLDKAIDFDLGNVKSIKTRIENASNLTLETSSVDRLIATHVLEHLYSPHEALREWYRVVKDGGIISILLPCDPGVAWRLGRSVGVRNKIVAAGIPDYDYWMAREHVNPINNLVAFIRYYFEEATEKWYPFIVPSMDINLFYVAHIRVSK
jgi:predicted SAM-dependent methyltransferase